MKKIQKINIYIIGGGIAGMTAAHELCKMKINNQSVFNIKIFEKDSRYIGGKARSIEHLENQFSKTSRFNFLPAEHGFRFFPSFYANMDQTLKEIPIENNGNEKPKSVFDNMVQTSTYMFSFFNDKKPIELLNRTQQWDYFGSLLKMVRSMRDASLDINSNGKNNFAFALYKMVTSSPLRKVEEFERESWFDFINAKNQTYGTDYANFFADGLTRSLAAAKSRKTSTRTGSLIFPKMLFEVIAPGGAAGRILNAPTNQAWLNHWKEHLIQQGVSFELNTQCVDIVCEKSVAAVQTDLKNRYDNETFFISDIVVKREGHRIEIDNSQQKSIFLFAIPVEKMAKLLTDSRDKDLFEADPSLKFIQHLKNSVDWMCGIVFFLKDKIEVTNGHINLLDTKWAITGIHQEQFWTADFQPEQFGNGDVKGILSLIMSNCDEDSNVCDKRSVFEMTREDIIKEAWEQIKLSAFIRVKDEHGNTICYRCPTEEDIFYKYTYLDESITERRDHALHEINTYLELSEDMHFKDFEKAYSMYKSVRNEEAIQLTSNQKMKTKKKVFVCENSSKLLVNYVNMYCNRPSTYTRIPNMFLAGDYVRTDVDLATMEGACESGKRAANAIAQTVKDSKFYNRNGAYNRLKLSKIKKYQNPFFKFLKTPLFIVFFLLVLISGIGTVILFIKNVEHLSMQETLTKIPLLKFVFLKESKLNLLICSMATYFKIIPILLIIYILVQHLRTRPEKKVLLFSLSMAVFGFLCIWFLYPLFFAIVLVILLVYIFGYLFFKSHIRMDEINYKKGMPWIQFSDGSIVKKLIHYLLKNSGKTQ